MWQWLIGWWDSLESVTRFRWWMGSLAITFALLAAVFGGFRWLADNRRDALKTQREQKLADPWRLSVEQEGQFVTTLRQAPSQIGLRSGIGDQYALGFGTKLDTLFTDAGWETHGVLGGDTYNPPLYGIRITIYLPPESNEEPPERSVLKSAFDAVGIRVKIDVDRTNPHLAGKFTWLHVGERPQS
jgi:hypothetical protein